MHAAAASPAPAWLPPPMHAAPSHSDGSGARAALMAGMPVLSMPPAHAAPPPASAPVTGFPSPGQAPHWPPPQQQPPQQQQHVYPLQCVDFAPMHGGKGPLGSPMPLHQYSPFASGIAAAAAAA